MSLIGHDAAVEAFREAIGGGRLHHAWLVAGPQGIGKARFAEAAALRYLAEGIGPVEAPGLDLPDDHPTVRYVAAGSHPDYRRLERLYREKTGDQARGVTVDQVRGLQTLFATTPSFSTRRAVVIDAIDDLERSGANALLKNLEEPPTDTLFLLVSHAPGRLLPTIRSRCRTLRLGLLGEAHMQAIIRRERPEADDAEIAALVGVGGGAPGQALRFAGLDIAGLDAAIDAIARGGDPTNAGRSALAKSLALKSAQPRYEAFLERAPARIAAAARTAPVADLAAILPLEAQARSLAGSALRLSLDPQATVFGLGGLLAALAPITGDAKPGSTRRR
ncbi:DNA polymerase III subunit delta' [Sphingomonas solaris]|uniref:DNA polymerase III subunit delta n=1 Tax=Alterirhizorhabdus solaris TaxID=2529389 RepID=A0A558R269_9SPHN|nr:DNA polymerase III subunit delta' [Sphingomonas solaris]TVV73481.1 DNA polymerase III subunit delta' [Sphingomonas solaris]